MLDTLQVLFWSITYVLIIIAGFRSWKIKKPSIPYLAVICNFAWESCALISSRGLWAHVAWFSLDLIIVILGFCFINSLKKKIVYISSLIVGVILLHFIFMLPNGMLYSSFAIDLMMAVDFLVSRSRLSPELKEAIAMFKLLGDTCAGLYYAPQSLFIAIIACIVFVCNCYYLYLCVKEDDKVGCI